MKKIMKVLYWLTGCLLWMIMIPGLFFVAPSAVGFRTFTVLSGSMEPVIPTGGIIVVNTHQKAPAPGEIITFQNGQTLVTHRVTAVTEAGYVTRGDANDYEDTGIRDSSQIVGTVCLTVPFLGYLIVFLQSRRGMFSLCILILSYSLLWGIQEMTEKSGQEHPQKEGKT